jgi:hypothetical protein
MMTTKTSTGPNARPKDESIAQTAPGIPNDSSRAVEIDEAEVEKVARKLRADISSPGERRK